MINQLKVVKIVNKTKVENKTHYLNVSHVKKQWDVEFYNNVKLVKMEKESALIVQLQIKILIKHKMWKWEIKKEFVIMHII